MCRDNMPWPNKQTPDYYGMVPIIEQDREEETGTTNTTTDPTVRDLRAIARNIR